MQSKQKVTLYIPPELHRRLKIKAAVDVESMSALVERAIAFYMQHPEKVDEIEFASHGKTHQVHFCPECSEALVVRNGNLVPVAHQDSLIPDDEISIKVGDKAKDSGESSEEELVSCL